MQGIAGIASACRWREELGCSGSGVSQRDLSPISYTGLGWLVHLSVRYRGTPADWCSEVLISSQQHGFAARSECPQSLIHKPSQSAGTLLSSNAAKSRMMCVCHLQYSYFVKL